MIPIPKINPAPIAQRRQGMGELKLAAVSEVDISVWGNDGVFVEAGEPEALPIWLGGIIRSGD